MMKIRLYETLHKIFKMNRNSNENSIDYESAQTILKNDKNAILIDVRSPQEYKEGHLEGSINFPLYDLERNSEKMIKNKENTIILYCQSGSRSKKALEILKKQGCSSLYQIEGGLDNMK